MAIELSSLRTLLAVNGVGPQSSSEEIKNILTAAKYSPEEITTALALLSQPVASAASTSTVSNRPEIPYEKRASSYPSVSLVVKEKKKHSFLGFILVLLLLVGAGVALYMTGTVRYLALWLHEDVVCDLMPDEVSRVACVMDAASVEPPHATP